MTVGELISKLKQYDKEDEVLLADDYENYRDIAGICDFPDYVILVMEDE